MPAPPAAAPALLCERLLRRGSAGRRRRSAHRRGPQRGRTPRPVHSNKPASRCAGGSAAPSSLPRLRRQECTCGWRSGRGGWRATDAPNGRRAQKNVVAPEAVFLAEDGEFSVPEPRKPSTGAYPDPAVSAHNNRRHAVMEQPFARRQPRDAALLHPPESRPFRADPEIAVPVLHDRPDRHCGDPRHRPETPALQHMKPARMPTHDRPCRSS